MKVYAHRLKHSGAVLPLPAKRLWQPFWHRPEGEAAARRRLLLLLLRERAQ